MKKMYYQENNSLPNVTINSLELLMRDRKIKRLRVDGQKADNKTITIPIDTTQGKDQDLIKTYKNNQGSNLQEARR